VIADKNDKALEEVSDKKDSDHMEGPVEVGHVGGNTLVVENTERSSEVSDVNLELIPGQLLDVYQELSELPKTDGEKDVKIARTESCSSPSATDACMNDVSDMKISDASSVVSNTKNTPIALQDDVVIVDNSAPGEPLTIDLTSDPVPSDDNVAPASDIIDLTEETPTAVIDLTQEVATVSKDHESSKISSRRPKRPPMAVYVPPRGRGPSVGTAAPPVPVKSATTVAAAATEATTKVAGGVDVTEQVITHLLKRFVKSQKSRRHGMLLHEFSCLRSVLLPQVCRFVPQSDIRNFQ
jgi:hypothetical protein